MRKDRTFHGLIAYIREWLELDASGEPGLTRQEWDWILVALETADPADPAWDTGQVGGHH
jgi:hypothetical protein